MPRYDIELDVVNAVWLDVALRLAAARFPELALEPAGLGGEPTTHWTCRAPSAAHIRRWANAAGVRVRSVRDLSDTAGWGAR
jgi:hypothetical protein